MAVRSFRFVHLMTALVALALCASFAVAENFRIETKVFVSDEKEPASETTTLFQNGVVYDFLKVQKKPEQTAVFRKANGDKTGQFILIDEQHSMLTKISTEKVDGAMTKLRVWTETAVA